MFSAKYCLSEPIKWIYSTGEGFLKNKFVFSDHSFTHYVAARWQDLMSRAWTEISIFFLIPHIDFGQCGDNCK